MMYQLKQFAIKNSINVEFQNGVSTKKLVELYNRAKVCAFPAIMEPGGLVPLEAQACGTPVIAVNEAGNRDEIHDGITGILTEREAKQFGNAIEQLVSDSKKAKTMGKKGVEFIRSEKTWEQSILKFEKLLLNLISV